MNIYTFGRQYRRFLEIITLLARLPPAISHPIAIRLSTYFSPLLQNRDAFMKSWLASGLPLDGEIVWRQRIADHAIFCLNGSRRSPFNTQWLTQHVVINTNLLKHTAAEGRGMLFMTYHHPFHHTLFCVLGLLGLRVQVLASPEESSPIYDQVGQYIHAMHRNCAHHFNGGDYLFFSQGHRGARVAAKALKNCDVLVSLNDLHLNSYSTEDNAVPLLLLGRRIQIPTGSIRLACRLGVPVITGIMLRDGLDYQVRLRRLDNATPQHIAAGYIDFLNETLLSNPAIWDGWDWFSTRSVP